MSYWKYHLRELFERWTHEPTPPEPPKPSQTIAEIASTNGNFDILVAALGVAGLTDTFNNPGDFTVFAPTDEAFTILARDTFGLNIDGLSEIDIALKLVDTLGVDTLKSILFYHVKSGATSVDDLQKQGTVDTLLADSSFGVDGDTLNDNDPEVEDPEFIDGLTDIAATNGTIHAIDRVLLPIDVAEAMAQPTIADIASGNPDFEALTGALVATGLVGLFTDPANDFTVFAPTDDAFRALAESLGIDTTDLADADLPGALVAAVGPELVTDILLYHVQVGSESLADLQDGRLVETALTGGRLIVDGNSIADAEPDRADPQFIPGLTDIEAINGEIHAIDSVLLPIDLPTVSARLIVGGFGDDNQIGSGGNDKLIGLAGDDIQLAGDGNDRAYGGWGQDQIFGGNGNDKLFGGSGRDRLAGDDGNDKLYGNRGNDTIEGGDGRDLLSGGSGADWLKGGDDNDRIYGGRGNDTLEAGGGDDVLFGGRGKDVFVFTELEGDNDIRDFRDVDVIALSVGEFANYTAVLDNVTFDGAFAELAGVNGTLTFNGAHLDESDFMFV